MYATCHAGVMSRNRQKSLPRRRTALALVSGLPPGMVKPPVSSGAAGKLAKRASEGVLERARRWLAPVYDRYSKNVLTHGEQYLRGDPEIPIGLEVEDWRAVPSLDHISLSRATLTATNSGGILLQGRYGGPLTAAQMLTGSALTEKPESAVGAGVCGMGSTGRWPWDLAQHHWLELELRTDGRPYEHPSVLRAAVLAAPQLASPGLLGLCLSRLLAVPRTRTRQGPKSPMPAAASQHQAGAAV